MPRSELLALLGRHVPADPAEAAMLAETIEFARRHETCMSAGYPAGHITASAWVVDPEHEHVLLTHHRKLDRWFQLGGHLEPGEAVEAGARREACEESGLRDIVLISPAIYDVDVHLIPASRAMPAHYHFDVRFCYEAARAGSAEAPRASAESRAVAWVRIDGVAALNNSESILRMVRKTPPPPGSKEAERR